MLNYNLYRSGCYTWANIQTKVIYDILEQHNFLEYLQALNMLSYLDIKRAIVDIAEEEFNDNEHYNFHKSFKKANMQQIISTYRIRLGFSVKKYNIIF